MTARHRRRERGSRLMTGARYSLILVDVAKIKLRALSWLRLDGKRAVRLLLTLEAAWWAFDLAMPWDTFPLSHVYDLLAACASERVWALLFLVDAVLCLCGFAGSRFRRIASAGLDGIMHAIVFTSAVVSSPGSTGTGTQTVWLAASYLLVEWEAMDG